MPKGSSVLMVGTRKGAFVFTSNDGRRTWKASGPWFEGQQVFNMNYDRRNGTLLACVNEMHWGPSVERSKDMGKSWKKTKSPPKFPKESGLSVKNVWHVEPGIEDEPDTLYLGVDPACLFKSEDGGETWTPNEAMMNHPTRKKWVPGAGGMCLHSVVLREGKPKDVHIAISAVGTMGTKDGGESWEFQNKHVRADFLPNKFPVYGQCVHKIVRNQSRPDVIYQQNHCGMYRSDDDGKDWVDISEGLPSRFGFPIAVDANEPKRVYTAPLTGDFNRVSPKGKFAIWSSDDSGKNWTANTSGLPKTSYFTVLRDAMSADDGDPCGVAFGTTTGHLFFSRNQGEDWGTVSDTLPPILSVAVSSV